MRLLDRQRSDGVAAYSIMLARESYLLAAQKSLYDLYSLSQPFDSDGTAIKVQANLFIFRSDAASTEAKFKSSICQEIDRCRFTSHKYGMAQVIVQHVRPDPELFRRFRGGYQCRYGGDAVSKVVGKGEGGIA
jgi:hypothetical protein